MQANSKVDEQTARSLSDERFDFHHATALRKSYVIASSARSGSTYLARLLAQTGLLGAPSEVFNSATNEMQNMMARFKAYSHADYVAKLIVNRTSRNGVFGMKAHFHQFEAFLKKYPPMLKALSPITYIYIDRRDKVAQAVSMAKALQTDQWSSQWRGSPRATLRYDRELIARSMSEVEMQDERWLRWFEVQNITPFRVTYEDLLADPAAMVRAVVERLGVQDDEPDDLKIPTIEKQGDDTNQEWIERFVREARADARGHAVAVMGGSGKGDFFERYDGLIKRLPDGANSATGFVAAIRLRRRYDALIGQNRALFRHARVLDLLSLDGFWSLAALDAGAGHVVAVETSQKAVRAGTTNLTELGVDSGSYRFINSKIFAALQSFAPEQFDVILCKGFVEHCQSAELFEQLSRLRPKHVILDTRISPGDKPITRFSLSKKSMKGRKGKITGTPTHDLIAFLSESDFRCRVVDWQAMGIEDWTGVPDYARDKHRTYVLDRLA